MSDDEAVASYEPLGTCFLALDVIFDNFSSMPNNIQTHILL